MEIKNLPFVMSLNEKEMSAVQGGIEASGAFQFSSPLAEANGEVQATSRFTQNDPGQENLLDLAADLL